MRKTMIGLAVTATLAAVPAANALTIDLIEGADDPLTLLPAALLAPSSGITIVGGSVSFVGRVGDGIDPNTAQSATYTGLNLVPAAGTGLPTISNPDGIFLTSGVANIPLTNTDTSFDHGSVGVSAPGTPDDLDTEALLVANSMPSTEVNDTNSLEFSFTVAPGQTSVEADFVFASDEFPDQGVTDIFAFFVDGTNYAFFQDGSLVSFLLGANAGNYQDNTGNAYPIEYDGISNSLHLVGLLDPSLATHTLKIVIADTSDTIFDSGLFIGNMVAGTATSGGVNPAPEPGSLALLGLGLAGLGLRRSRRRS